MAVKESVTHYSVKKGKNMKKKSINGINKEKLEKETLYRSIILSKKKGKLTRDILSHLDGEMVERDRNDNPDMIVKSKEENSEPAECIIGIEHFLVEQVTDPKRGSVIKEKKTYVEKIINSVKEGDAAESLQKAKEEVTSTAFDIAAKANTTGIRELKEAFHVAFMKHLANAENYRKNTALCAEGKPVKLAFLIEIHSNANDVFLNIGETFHRRKNDIYPLFCWMVEELEKIDPNQIEYVVLYMRNSLNPQKEDVIAIDTSDIQGSLHQQGIIAYEYCEDPGKVIFPKNGFSERGLEYSVEITNENRYVMDAAPILKQAYEYRKRGIPFVAPRPVQAMLYSYGEEGFTIISSYMVPNTKVAFEAIRRFDVFVSKYPVGDKK